MATHRFAAGRADRLDKLVAAGVPALTRSAAQRLIDHDRVRVNGEIAHDAGRRTSPADLIEVESLDAAPPPAQPEAIPLDILYQDDAILVVVKPAGMVTHPGAGQPDGTLVNAALALAPDMADSGDDARPGIVHRLDKHTSGVMVLARSDAALGDLQAQFRRRAIHKTYLALCVGDMQPRRGVIDKPIARDPRNRQRMAIAPAGREAQTAFDVIAATPDLQAGAAYSLVRARPRTGRTHQLRVHFASLGFPIVGDAVYGGAAARRDPLSAELQPRHMLHAARIAFTHPISGAALAFDAPLPADFHAVVQALFGEAVLDSLAVRLAAEE